MSFTGFLSQLLEIVIAIAIAPLLTGWVNQWRAWLQNKSAPSLWQPYRMLHKLFNKESMVADNASPLFRTAPYVKLGCMVLACAIIPTLSTDLPLAPAADAIALVGLFALARVFISLAAMDIGTAFGTMGARREMLVGFLAEPALLMVLFSASLISKSTSLTTIVGTLAHRELTIYPGLAFAGVAFAMVASEVDLGISDAEKSTIRSAGSARKPISISRRAPIVPKAVPMSMAASEMNTRARANRPTSAIASAAGARGRSVDSVGMMAQASTMQPNIT